MMVPISAKDISMPSATVSKGTFSGSIPAALSR